MFYDTLIVSQRSCPESCTLCVDACAKRAGDGYGPVIQKIDVAEKGYHTVLLCNQCSRPECVGICPTGALSRSTSGVVVVDSERCIGCGLCRVTCPYGGIYLDTVQKKAYKCDMCAGSPVCVEACPHGILSYKQTRRLVGQLGEDVLSPGLPFCAGCLMELLSRFTLEALGKNIVLFGSPGCSVLGGRCTVAYYGCLMTNIASSMTGVKRYLDRINQEATCVGIVGDGATADIGFQVLSGAAERGEKILYICYDNEAYMNTGIQRSSTTPLGSRTTTTQVGKLGRGKRNVPKNVPLLMAFHEIAYVATATLSHLEDYAAKLKKAQAATREGMAYIHVLCPCPTGWRSATENPLEVCRAAVETNYFPLWEAEYGEIRLTHKEKHAKSINNFTKLMGRFSHLTGEEIDRLQEYVDHRYKKLTSLAHVG